MTREEAIEVLEKMKYPQKINKNGFIISNVNIENEALEMAIQALSQEPTDTWSIKDVADAFERHGLMKEQEQCDDAISREAVIEWLENATYEDISDAVGTELSFLPSVTQKSGKWGASCTCSVCGQWRILESEKNDGKYKYCPNCGAKMESEE